ncbi:MAG: GAF domain-containing protein [Armatimonadetes bacterium]|nr:GAF domain-containing protein [Armatimonadota bacterium]NIM23143.1 GAF domain-containing protein [Armatimonadota bacterium]NIM67011.1 GAF domain-containing protein [Armatimonadota bacterium]NIM75545.1 GAF domain-containing protein [Armatimonadota bacterium]NIN05200.1 GAF domain-containing protein [Armatimonadota bacterium]
MAHAYSPSTAELQAELQRLRADIGRLEQARRALEAQLAGSVAPSAPITTSAELQATLRRFLKQVGLIVQAEKCVIMLYDEETGDLVATSPALGISDEEVAKFRIPATQGISGQVFREMKPVLCHDAMSDPRTVNEMSALLKVRNSITVPLVAERKNAEDMVVERKTIGIFHAYNKRFAEGFGEEDVALLKSLARNAAAVISTAKTYIAVADEKRELEHTFQSMVSGVMVVSGEGKLRLMNAAARQIFGVPRGDRLGGRLQEVIFNSDVEDLVNNALTSGIENIRELSIFTPEERVFQVQTALLRDDDQQVSGVVTTFNDITELRNVERMKTEFVSSVSHELRTPLTSIKGFVRTMLDDSEGYYERDMQREFLGIIDSECDRLVRLISDLLNVSRIESGRSLELSLKRVNLPELIERRVESQRSYTSRHEFVVHCDDGFPELVADEDKVDQILTNLLSNAVKYSPEGGKVTVDARDCGDTVSVSISDEGIGIPPEHLDKVFLRFHRVDSMDTRQAGGTGIGLYLVKHLVDAHRGSMEVTSEVGKGSTFKFTLPKTQPEQEGSTE